MFNICVYLRSSVDLYSCLLNVSIEQVKFSEIKFDQCINAKNNPSILFNL